jgi:hypothetical protein
MGRTRSVLISCKMSMVSRAALRFESSAAGILIQFSILSSHVESAEGHRLCCVWAQMMRWKMPAHAK